jgi:hypothetical protein
MLQSSEPIECSFCHKSIYAVPTRPKKKEEEVLWFEKLDWPWKVHFCPHHAGLEGVTDVSPRNLAQTCQQRKFPEPFLLVIVICVKEIPGTPQDGKLYVIALKSILGEKLCYFFRGDEAPRWGDLAALCGVGEGQRLLVNSNHVLNFDGQADPGYLHLSWHSDPNTRECTRCRAVLDGS